MSISANDGPPADRPQGIAVIRKACDMGVTFFDTAGVYGPYTGEQCVGEAVCTPATAPWYLSDGQRHLCGTVRNAMNVHIINTHLTVHGPPSP